jgi:hypothetical protein
MVEDSLQFVEGFFNFHESVESISSKFSMVLISKHNILKDLSTYPGLDQKYAIAPRKNPD